MRGKEVIVLDAELISVISEAAFEARLANGHRFTAYIPSSQGRGGALKLRPGSKVKVRFSPYSMAQAEIVLDRKCDVQG